MTTTGKRPPPNPCVLPQKVADRATTIRHYTILVTGMDSKGTDKYANIVRDYNRDLVNKEAGLVMLRCDNPKESSIITDIMKSVCRVNLDPSTSYIRKVRATVRRKMKTGVPITLIGYSYGGSAVDRALDSFRERIDTDDIVAPYFTEKKLKAYAFGSIHVADTPARVFPVKHYLFEDDWPSTSCNHMSPPRKNDKRRDGVRWLPTPPDIAAIANKFERGIKLHKSYPIHKAYPRNDAHFKEMLATPS